MHLLLKLSTTAHPCGVYVNYLRICSMLLIMPCTAGHEVRKANVARSSGFRHSAPSSVVGRASCDQPDFQYLSRTKTADLSRKSYRVVLAAEVCIRFPFTSDLANQSGLHRQVSISRNPCSKPYPLGDLSICLMYKEDSHIYVWLGRAAILVRKPCGNRRAARFP